ncbi:MAG: ATP-binding protein [Paludibacteraceae bacterium]|nr:ATP-binding protein [Paludibacteraceae bacterium]
MSDVKKLGKVSATEKNPSTIDDFYFWTKAGVVLNPFDIVKVQHINGSTTYGAIESISHVTDSASHLSSFISSEFGEITDTADGNTDRLAFNYVHVKVVGNDKGIYTPVLHGNVVTTCTPDDIKKAYGLDKVKNPLPCGYLEMYGEKVPVNINADFLVGPDGAHLNISGISGLACKTSYCMFLLNAMQQKYSKEDLSAEHGKTAAYVIFNVKGQDLLTIDKEAQLDDTEKQKYALLNLQPKPFKNVSYFYPYSKSAENHHMQTFGNWDEIVHSQWSKDKLGIFKYTWKACKDRLEYIFANEDIDDASGTMASIIAYIESEKEPFNNVHSWQKFKLVMKELLNNDDKDKGKEMLAKTNIALVSWKKFNRIMEKVLCDEVFTDDVSEDSHEVVLSETLKDIKPNEVRVIDIAHLDEKSQGFVFGDVMDTLHSMMSAKNIDGMPDKIVVFVDELNKYAGKDTPKSSQILQQLLEITERGRSLGLILFSVEQFKSAIHDRVRGNCATSAYGRTNFVEVANSEYRYYGETYRNMMTRLDPGEYIISNPAMRSLMKINFPRPVYKENK